MSKLKQKIEKLKFQKKLKKLYVLNQKNINKVNDNLIKIMADPELLLHAYEHIQVNKRFLTLETGCRNIINEFN